MRIARSHLKASTLLVACLLAISPFADFVRAQNRVEERLKPDVQRALDARTRESLLQTRKDGYAPAQSKASLPARPISSKSGDEAITEATRQRRPARLVKTKSASSNVQMDAASYPRITPGTPLSWILHTSQLSLTSSAGTDEQYVNATGDFVADERTTFDTGGGSFDIAVGRSGARYEVYSATLDNRRLGVLAVGLDTNGDYVRDSSTTFDLERDFGLPSAVSVVSGTSRAGREFVIVSSSGYYNFDN